MVRRGERRRLAVWGFGFLSKQTKQTNMDKKGKHPTSSLL